MSLQVFILNGWATGKEIWEPFIGALCKSLALKPVEVHLLSWDAATDPADYKRLAIDFIEGAQIMNYEIAVKDDSNKDDSNKDDSSKYEINDNYLLMGWSLGAMVALDIWSDLKHKPSAIMIFSGSPSFCHVSKDLGWPRSDVEAMRNRLASERDTTLKAFYQRSFTSKERDLGYDQRMLEDSGSIPALSLISGLDYLIQSDLNCRISEIDSPVLWLHGDRDRICPIGGAGSATNQLKQVQVVSLPQAGHGIIMTAIEETVAALHRFLCSRGDFHD